MPRASSGAMRNRLEPLLAELHAHTRWSDGELTTRELVDLYGRQGFDVLCITDHVVRSDDLEADGSRARAVSQRDYPAYLAEVAVEALRARARARGARRPVRALQPVRALPLGGRGGAARRRHRRHARLGAPLRLEDAPAMPPRRASHRRLPPLAATGVPDQAGAGPPAYGRIERQTRRPVYHP